MSQIPSTATSSTNFGTVFTAALKAYQEQTGKDIASHPLATQLQSCDSSSAILAVLQTQVQTVDQSQNANEKWTKWVDPTVNVLFAFSGILNNVAGVVFPPATMVFTGIGVLLQAIKDVRDSQDVLIDLFGRMEYLFKRLEAYIQARPTPAMTDFIVKITVEVISILGIVTKEIAQGRITKYVKKLFGRKDLEDALQQLDKLTQEEARMATAENLMITRDTDDAVRDVDERLKGVDQRVQGVDTKVEAIEDTVQNIDGKVQGVDDKMQAVDDTVKVLDHKVDSVIEGVEENEEAIRQMVKQRNEEIRKENLRRLRESLRQWVVPPDPSVNYNTASGAHHEGTAMWCTKGNTLADWKTSGSLLWIHGKPGSGKSVLSSVIIRDINSMSSTGASLSAYFYFDFKDTTKQDSRALLSSLIVQLFDQSEIFSDAIYSLYSTYDQGSRKPTIDSLSQCFKDMLTTAGPVPIYLILDGLDECPYGFGLPSPREKVLDLVDELVKLRHQTLRLCVTSRPEFDIRTALEPLATQQVSIHNESGQTQDINNFVTNFVHSDRRIKRWRVEEKDMVIEKLTEKADGMFRWVYCQLEVLRYCFPTNVRRILEELPKSLDETYERILKEINNTNWEHAYRLLQCLAVARRPLRVEELAEMLSFDINTGGIPKVIADWRWEDREEAVLSACSSLVTVITHDGFRVVQFSHFSVKEFLTSDRLADFTEEVSRFRISLEPSHMIFAKACLAALLCPDNKKVSLVRYAAEYWVEHAKVGNMEIHVTDSMNHIFDMDKPYFLAWVRIHDIDKPRSWSPWWRSIALTPASPLYYAAFCGFRGVVKHLIDKHPQHVRARVGRYGTPLHATLLNGHIEVAQLLREHGADLNALDVDKETPLHLMSKHGRLAAAKWLLDCGADVNPQDQYGSAPLHWATTYGHLEVARILLKHSAAVDARSVNGATSLILGSEMGRPDIVQLLLDHNADPSVCDNKKNTPLHFAASFGRLEVSRILLKRNVEVNPQNNEGLTPLRRASAGRKKEHLDVVQLLLDHGADSAMRNRANSNGKT